MKREGGTTLLELLVASVILTVVAAAIYTVLSQSARLWSRASRPRPQWEIDLVLEKISSELRNAFAFEETGLEGGSDFVEFFTVAPAVDRAFGEAPVRVPVKVRYYYDPARRAVCRRQTGYRQVLYPKGAAQPGEEVMARNIDGFDVKYYHENVRSKTVAWRKAWRAACLPRALKLSLKYDDGRPQNLMRLLPVPQGNDCLAV
ncbi:MAG: prepilin-type N-terminal cleavage/methylation domain-containing protein [Candidatus Omnitrophica bacterium]|nr:prepilin-type N-terminal cleavage/methylation domain-containing protein [Candidatus Omnitrophota bacterium]